MKNYLDYFERLNPPAPVSEILETEVEMGFRIPTPYRNFLLMNNGGDLIENKGCFQIQVGNKHYDDGIRGLEGVFSLKGFISATKYIEQTDNVYYFFNEMVGITVTNLAGWICMGYLPENYGQIFWVNHVAYVGILDHLWPIKLANSLENFLEMLAPIEDLA
jgi:hypothetical protein